MQARKGVYTENRQGKGKMSHTMPRHSAAREGCSHKKKEKQEPKQKGTNSQTKINKNLSLYRSPKVLFLIKMKDAFLRKKKKKMSDEWRNVHMMEGNKRNCCSCSDEERERDMSQRKQAER